MVCGAGTAAQEQPVGADPRPVPPLEVLLHAHRLLTRVLDVHLEVVLQVLADTRQVVYHVDAERLQFACVADAGQLQQLRAVDGAAAQDDLGGFDALGCAEPVPIVDPDRALALEHDPLDERPGYYI